jgi:DNA-binding phage protein
MRFLSKPKINREHFIVNKDIDQDLIRELSIALDNLNIDKIKSVLMIISKTHHRTQSIPETLGISRSSFYNILSPSGNPGFITILRLLNLFDIKFTVETRRNKR